MGLKGQVERVEGGGVEKQGRKLKVVGVGGGGMRGLL